MTAPPRRIVLQGGRVAEMVETPIAGRYLIRVVEAGPDEWEGRGTLTWRQAEALRHLGRIRRMSGLSVAWLGPIGGRERPEERVASARDEYEGLMAAVREPTRGHLRGMLASAEWPVLARVSEVRAALAVVADWLRLPPDPKPKEGEG